MPKQKTITSQAAIKPVLQQLDGWTNDLPGAFDQYWALLESAVLVHRVKFPILEFLAKYLHQQLGPETINRLMEQMAQAKHESCYPVIGKLLQLELANGVPEIYDKAIAHIIQGNEWYVCDIISERVFGEGTLRDFDQSMIRLKQMGHHENFWIQRSIGIATHYATKKKLEKEKVEQLLLLMMEHAHKTQYFTKKGIGWAGKTIAKWHPDLIRKHEADLKATKLCRWFISKMNIGLSMAKAAPFVYE